MKEYKRLTERKIDLDKLTEKAKSRISDTYLEYAKMNNALWELETKIENGTLIDLPCKVGDTVYYVIKHEEDYVMEVGFIRSISIQPDGIWLACHYNSGLSYWHKHKDEKLFFDIAEAEAKLKELQGND